MTRRGVRRVGAAAAVVALALAACTDDDDTSTDAATTAVDASADPSGEPLAPTPAEGSLFGPGDVDAGLQPWIDTSTEELAAALGVDTASVTTVSAVLVVWPDAALGCPEPDELYATVETDGAVIELAVDGTVYRFHAGGDREPFLCERPITDAPARL